MSARSLQTISSTMGIFKLFNTLTRQVEEIRPLQEGKISMYTCGPTVYGDSHVGNYRTFIFEDVLVKALRRSGFQVNRVMNITDVGHLVSDGDEGDDKLEVGARREGISAWDVAKKYEERFLADLEKLGIERPTKLVRATDTIQDQIDLIANLETKGFTYRTSDGVYFDSGKLSDYGKLARLDLEGLQAGNRVEMGEKRRATDFALWKFSPEGQKRDMEWESPWGTGFPGWHIECSAIIRATLGDQIDIHCGGVDHIPVHHTNEIAQSETATGKSLASIWSHAEFLLMDGGKMAKSLGNLYTVADLEQAGYDPLVFKFFTYGASYRSKLNFTWEALAAAATALERLRDAYQAPDKGTETQIQPYLDRFLAALQDDLNTAQALAVLWEVAAAPLTQAARQQAFDSFDEVVGLDLGRPFPSADLLPEVQALADERIAARAAKDWSRSDELRDQIEGYGYEVQDGPDGQTIKKRL